MKDYRGDSLDFLYSVMRGRIKEKQAIIDKDNATVQTVKTPVSVEGRMKAAERMLRFFEKKDLEQEDPEEYGVIFLSKVDMESDINSSGMDD